MSFVNCLLSFCSLLSRLVNLESLTNQSGQVLLGLGSQTFLVQLAPTGPSGASPDSVTNKDARISLDFHMWKSSQDHGISVNLWVISNFASEKRSEPNVRKHKVQPSWEDWADCVGRVLFLLDPKMRVLGPPCFPKPGVPNKCSTPRARQLWIGNTPTLTNVALHLMELNKA